VSEVKECCGVIGSIDERADAIDSIWLGLLALQHRGQESNGVYTFDGKRFYKRKELGLLDGPEAFSNLKGQVGIGHVRYSTVGEAAEKMLGYGASIAENFAQPFFVDYQRKGMALCHNGNIVNNVDLARYLLSSGIFLASSCDAEIMLKMLVLELTATKDLEESVRNCMGRFEGAYSTTIVTGEGEIMVFRDPFGFRPLCYGVTEELKMAASESVALNVNRIDLTGDVKPGEMIVFKQGEKIQRKQIVPCKRTAHCMFEYVYFSRPDSVLDGKDVYAVRTKLGRNLAKAYKADADVIVPVPDTARSAAEGISAETGIRVSEGLIKNRYIGRTFIMPEQQKRSNYVNVKLNPIKSVINGKKVILVDDSIVRGTTSRKIVDLVKKAGASQIYVWATCPPIRSPCFYGIDIATHEELIAASKTIPQVARTIGADELHYQTLEGLIDAIGSSRDELCLACLTGEYPTPMAQAIADQMKGRVTQGRRYFEIFKEI